MGGWNEREQYLPVIAMVTLECIYAIMTLMNRDALNKGMSPWVFVFYRQVIASLVTCPVAFFFSRKKSSGSRMELRTFLLMFATAFVGVALYQIFTLEGLKMVSTSAATAMFNLVPAITFLMATILGLEQINLKRLSTIAKILGTILCIVGAISITLLKGQKLLNSQLLQAGAQNWLLGCLVLLASFFCLSSFLILQVPITERYPDHLSLSAWMCFLAMLQTGVLTVFMERDPKSWVLHSSYEVYACLFSGICGSGLQYFIQSWCVSRRGPLFCAMFNPLMTVLATFFATLLFHEEVYIGTLLGAIGVIIGLYVVIWGKSEEMKEKMEVESIKSPPSITTLDKSSCNLDLEQPLLKE